MSATLLLDLGNSRLKVALLHDDAATPGAVTAIGHDGEALPPGWDAALPECVDAAAVTCVAAPALRAQLLDALAARCGRISIVRTSARFGDVRIAYPVPGMLGTDRFLALLGARARGPGPWLVAGVGTAITLDLIDADGLHHGGRIAPSPALMREALHRRAPQLPPHGGIASDFADNTLDALRAGCDAAALGLLHDTMAAATARLGAPPRWLLHGGGIDSLPVPADALRAPSLVLEGLAAWARMRP